MSELENRERREWRAKNIEAVRPRERAYYEANKGRINERRRERRSAHVKEIRGKDRSRYERDRERLKGRQLKYYHQKVGAMNNEQYEKLKEFWNTRQKSYYAKWIAEVHGFLGAKCVCCGEREREFLCIDHVKNDGKREKKNKSGSRSRPYVTEIRKAFLSKDVKRISKVKERFQLLCQNCNYSKHRGKGICVHMRGDPLKHPEYPYTSATARCG